MKFAYYKSARELRQEQLDELIAIAAEYYPAQIEMGEVVKAHLREGGAVIIAHAGHRVAGFSIASEYVLQTPFHGKPIPVIYQREMFIAPIFRKHHVGIALQIETIKSFLGPLWFARRFAMFCGTHNPLIVRNFAFFTQACPNLARTPLDDRSGFRKVLLDILHGEAVDEHMCVSGTFKSALKGVDYSHWWHRYLCSPYEDYNRLVLESLFDVHEGEVRHRGVTLLLIGYAKPFVFLKRFLVIRRRALWRWLRTLGGGGKGSSA